MGQDITMLLISEDWSLRKTKFILDCDYEFLNTSIYSKFIKVNVVPNYIK